AGMLLTSIASGQLISRGGGYRIFPIAGTAVMAFGLYLLSHMNADTTLVEGSLHMPVLGCGLGLVMQVLISPVQNAVDYPDLGVATSGATLFRLIGGSLGTAVFGAIFASRLAAHLQEAAARGIQLPHGTSVSPDIIANLDTATRAVYIDAFTASLSVVFLSATAIVLVGFALTFLLPEHRLRETIAAVAQDIGREAEAIFPMPTDASSVARLERALSLIAFREDRKSVV